MAPVAAEQPMQNGSAYMDSLQPSDEDLLYEEELLRNPYSLKMWCRYLEARKGAPARRRYILYERALKALPVSYKVRTHRPTISGQEHHQITCTSTTTLAKFAAAGGHSLIF